MNSRHIEIPVTLPEYNFETGEVIDPGIVEFISTPPLTLEGLKRYPAIIEKRLNAFVLTRAYRDIGSACSHVSSCVPEWRAEGEHCVKLRDATWLAFYKISNEAVAGQRSVPTWDELLELLPKLEWPDVEPVK